MTCDVLQGTKARWSGLHLSCPSTAAVAQRLRYSAKVEHWG